MTRRHRCDEGPTVHDREPLSAEAVRERVGAALGVEPVGLSRLSGGEVGTVFRVDLADDRAVVAKTGPTPHDVEAEMLRYLGGRGLPVPAVLAAATDLLVLEFVPGDDVGRDLGASAERDAARHLATLHDHAPPDPNAGRFGFDRDTLSGRLTQPNPWAASWADFFADHRIRWSLAVAAEAVPARLADRVAALADDVAAGEHLPDPEPCLLHGDVWPNNLVVRDGAVRAFLDPACYYGHAEVDLAYATWAGLGEPFLAEYAERRGIEPGFAERKPLYLLPDRLLHAWYFDPAEYLPAVRETLAGLDY